jgi:hypothetical protein
MVALLVSAAPAGAALPEDGVTACQKLRSKLVYLGQADQPFQYRLFHENIEPAWIVSARSSDHRPSHCDAWPEVPTEAPSPASR